LQQISANRGFLTDSEGIEHLISAIMRVPICLLQ